MDLLLFEGLLLPHPILVQPIAEDLSLKNNVLFGSHFAFQFRGLIGKRKFHSLFHDNIHTMHVESHDMVS